MVDSERPEESRSKGTQTYVRLPDHLRRRYEAAAAVLVRSVSFLLRRAAERDIEAIEEEAREASARKTEAVALREKGTKYGAHRTTKHKKPM